MLRLQFEIPRINIVGQIKRKNAWNHLDETGLTIGLSRLPDGEEDRLYRRRLTDVFAHPANSTYLGIVYGLTRELGFDLFYPVEINPRLRTGGKFFARDPMVEFNATSVVLYSDYTNSVIDLEIDRFERGGNYEYIGLLVEAINNSTYFEATLLSEDYRWIRSTTILNQINRISYSEPAQRTTKSQLKPFICSGTFYPKGDSSTFKQEILEVPTSVGYFHLDYNKGILSTFAPPTTETTLYYDYSPYPWKPTASPVVCYSISDENFKKKLFHQIEAGDGTTVHGLPTNLGGEIINELLSVVPMYWGK